MVLSVLEPLVSLCLARGGRPDEVDEGEGAVEEDAHHPLGCSRARHLQPSHLYSNLHFFHNAC
jgi:hypothetical protein